MQCLLLLLLSLTTVFCDWKTSVLKKHNELRSKVASGKQSGAPTAKYMAKLVWDKKLASDAQAYANRCVFEHDKNRGKVGENLAMDSRRNSYKRMVQAWYDEVDLARVPDYNVMSRDLFAKGMGHYTQLVWGESTKIGCGYRKGCRSGRWTMEYLVCRYDPPGNYFDHPIYETGKTCSKCSGSCKGGLCSGNMKGNACKDGYSNCADLTFWCKRDANIKKKCVKSCTKC